MSDTKPIVRGGVGVMIVRDGKMLLGKRHSDPAKADSALHGEGAWTMPGGKLDFGDTFESGATREALEETGLKLNRVEVMCVGNEIAKDAQFVTIGTLCTDFEGEPQVMEPDEIVEWRWFPIEEPPSPMFPPSEKMRKNYLEKQFYKY